MHFPCRNNVTYENAQTHTGRKRATFVVAIMAQLECVTFPRKEDNIFFLSITCQLSN